MSKEKNVSITNPSPLYFFEIIEATKKGAKDIDGKSDLKFTWIYEGQDMFLNPDNATNKLYNGGYVAKELWDLLNAGYKVKCTTKDGVVKEFNTSGEFLVFCFSNNMKVCNMQTLNEYIKEYRGLKKIDIKNLLNGVKDARGISENINFDFDHIGFDRDIGRTSFETTSENNDFHFELSKFLIRLLRHIDVDDKDALTLGYRLFVRSSKDNYKLEDLLTIINEKVA